MFNHEIPTCGTTLAMAALAFRDLHAGPVFKARLTPGDEGCPGFCQYEDNLMPCPGRCSCAYVRDILQQIKAWPKRKRPGAKGKASP